MTTEGLQLETGIAPGSVSRLYDDAPDTVCDTHLTTDGDETLCGEPRINVRPYPLVGDLEVEAEVLLECDTYVVEKERMCEECRREYFDSEEGAKSWRHRYAEIVAGRGLWTNERKPKREGSQ